MTVMVNRRANVTLQDTKLVQNISKVIEQRSTFIKLAAARTPLQHFGKYLHIALFQNLICTQNKRVNI